MVDQWLYLIQSWLYPPTCLLCGAPGADGRDLCRGCHADLPLLAQACHRCAAPLAGTDDSAECGRCQQRPPHFDRARALCHYAPPADRLLLDLKFNGRLPQARLMGGLLADRLEREAWPRPECLIPVPLHASRLRQRGFNQSLELARPIAARLGIPIAKHHCRRVRASPPQSSLPARRRHTNVRGCFAVRTPLPFRHAALIDDVITSGHTVNELARVLRSAGAETIEVWAWARTTMS